MNGSHAFQRVRYELTIHHIGDDDMDAFSAMLRDRGVQFGQAPFYVDVLDLWVFSPILLVCSWKSRRGWTTSKSEHMLLQIVQRFRRTR